MQSPQYFDIFSFVINTLRCVQRTCNCNTAPKLRILVFPLSDCGWTKIWFQKKGDWENNVLRKTAYNVGPKRSEQLQHNMVEPVVFIDEKFEYSQKQDHDITSTAPLAEQNTFDILSYRADTKNRKSKLKYYLWCK